MRQVLENDNEGVVIYVAPNKALVNQAQAQTYRFFGDVFGVVRQSKFFFFLSFVFHSSLFLLLL